MKTGINVGDILRFDGKRNLWRVRAKTSCGRYAIATNKVSNRVYYTILDFEEKVRGAMNILGGGLSIFSTNGRDKNINKAIEMLEKSLSEKKAYFQAHPENLGKVHYNGEWEVSHRNRVPLKITTVKHPTPLKKPAGPRRRRDDRKVA